MALDTLITGTNLDAGGNVKVALNNTPAYVGGVRLQSENDAGTLTGVPYLKAPETSMDYRLRVGVDTILFTDSFNALVQNTTLWSYASATVVMAQGGGGTLNITGGTAASQGASLRSYQYFPIIGTAPLAVDINMGQFTTPLAANEIFVAGFGVPISSSAPPTDGVYFQITSAGVIGVLAYNGSFTQSGILEDFSNFALNELHNYMIVVGETEIEFWKDSILLGQMGTPHANGQPFMSAAAPVFVQKYCSGAVTNTCSMRVSDITVTLMDINTTKAWAHLQACQGLALYNQPNGFTTTATGTKTSIWANNTAPTAVALSNTGGAFIGLGGIGAVLPTLAVASDGILFSFLNSTGGVNSSGRNLVITGVTLQGAVSVILAGGPVTYAYALAYGHTSISLATAETLSFVGTTTHAPKIVALGMDNFVATAPVGTLGTRISLTLTTPIVVRSGEFVQLIARNIGTVTTTGAITFVASYDGYWE
jgi:hypothetical protein